jgi:RNA-directed DNA polymerase
MDDLHPKIQRLRSCDSISSLAHLLGYKPQSLSFILYKIPIKQKYSEFEIPKKSGGNRVIMAPTSRLKILQRRLADLLYDCEEDLFPNVQKAKASKGTDNKKPTRERARKAISHGYKKGLSITTNAEIHLDKRFVFNIDLQSFFPSINFGRVRGFFIKNKNFKLHPKVATLIAQIVCHDNQLPQGSPCSPVISNFIARSLDLVLLKAAKEHMCDYTRYVDDITFSSNLKSFSPKIAMQPLKWWGTSKWKASKSLKAAIELQGFNINESKCRMQKSIERQEVTGLVVNKRVNVSSDYYRTARAMCNSLFSNGYYFKPDRRVSTTRKQSLFSLVLTLLRRQKNIQGTYSHSIQKEDSLRKLNGILSYIYNIKSYRNKFADVGYRRTKHDGIRKKTKEKYPPLDRTQSHSDESHQVALDGIKNLYQKFLFFKFFHYSQTPLIVCEGKTDNVYLKCAIEGLANHYPELIDKDSNLIISFLNRTKTTNEMLSMAEGTSGLTYLLEIYKRFIKKFKVEGKRYPVIIIVDDDDEGRKVAVKANGLKEQNRKAKGITKLRSSSYIFENLYVIKIPSTGGKATPIEGLFEPTLLKTKLNGKEFHIENSGLEPNKHYGKDYFSRYVVRANKKTINFTGFKTLLDEIKDVVNSYDPKDLD